jgi:hypothetical protein
VGRAAPAPRQERGEHGKHVKPTYQVDCESGTHGA